MDAFFVDMISIPFSGSKRYSYKNVKAIVVKGGYKTVYEPFGGSCVLSVNLLNEGIVQKAVVNDYDRFFDHYEEYLDLKDLVVSKCFEAGLVPVKRHGKRTYYVYPDGTREDGAPNVLESENRKILQRIIKDNVNELYWKYFALGTNFTHSTSGSHKVIKLRDFCAFGGYLGTDKQRAFLKALDNCVVENLDYKDFINKYKSELSKDSIFIIDPPYSGRAQGQYRDSFDDCNTKEVLDRVLELGIDFIFFTDNERPLERWLEDYDYTVQKTGKPCTTANHKRQDTMIYVKR